MAGHAVGGGIAKRGAHLVLDGVGDAGFDHGVGEERAGGPGVMVGGIEHHALAAAQGEDLLADLGDGAALAGGIGKLPKAQGAREPIRGQLQFDLEHHRAAGEFQVGIAVGQIEIGDGNPLIGIGAQVIQAHTGQDLRNLGAIGTHVLHGHRAHRAGDAGQALDAAQGLRHGFRHDLVPYRTGLGAHEASFGIHVHRGKVEDDGDHVYLTIRNQQVGAAANHNEGNFFFLEVPQCRNCRFRQRATQRDPWLSPHAQGGEISKARRGIHVYAVDCCELLRQKFIKHVYQGSLLSMSTRSENTVTINQPIDMVHKALLTQGYWEYIVANLSPEAGQVHDFSDNVATLYEVLPTTLLPEAVRAMVSQDLKVKRVVTVGELNGQAADVNYTADVKGTPVDFKGDISLAGEGEMTKLTYTNEISVKIPMMGAAIEPKVGESLAELFDNEGKLTEQWISENS